MTRGDTRSALRSFGAGVHALLALRWVKVVLVLGLAALFARLAAGRILWAAVDRAARSRGLACEWEDLDLSLLSGRAEVSWLVLRPSGAPPESEPLLAVEYGVFDLELLPLLRGHLRIRRGELDGIDLLIERGPEGGWNAQPYLQAAASPVPPEPLEPETEEEPVEWRYDLAPPFAADALRIDHARLRLVDRAIDPPLDVDVEASVRLSNLGIEGRPARFSAMITGGDVFDGASLVGEATGTSDALHMTVRAQAGSLRLAPLAPYLLAVDMAPACESLSAGMSAELDLAVIGAEGHELRGTLLLERVRLGADGAEALALDRLHAGVSSFSEERTQLTGIELAGLRARASREPNGALRVAGIDLLPAAPRTGPPEPWTRPIQDLLEVLRPAALPRWARLLGQRDPDAYPWSLGSLVLTGGEIDFSDRAVEPRADIQLLVDRVALGEVVHDPAAEPRPIPFEAALRSPGAADSIRLTGALGPFAPARSVDVSLEVDGIALSPVEGHLRAAGFSSALEQGSFRLHLTGQASTDANGRTEGWLELGQMELTGDEELVGVRNVAARGLVYDPAVPLLRAGDVEIDGPRLALVRDASRQMVVFGMRTLGFAAPHPEGEVAPVREEGPPGAPDAQAAPDAGVRVPPAAPVVFELGRLAWSNSRVEVTDRLMDPPRRLVLGELTFVLEDLTLGGDPAGPEPPPARFSAHLSSEELVDELSAEGTVRSRPGQALDLTAQLALRGRGLRGNFVGPYLRAIGLEPALSNAALALDLEAGLLEEEGGWRAHMALRDALLTEGEATLLSLDELRLDDMRIGETFELGELALVRPFVSCERDAEGVTSIAGWRLIGAPAEEAAGAPSGAPAEPPAPPALPELAAVLVHKLALEGGRIAWRSPELAVELLLDAQGSELGTLGAPGALSARLAVPGALEALELDATLALGGEELAVSGSLAASGIRAGPLAALWPAGVEPEPGGARFALEVDAALRAAEAGGLAARVALRNLSAGETGAEPSLAVGEAEVEVARYDPVAGVLELGAVRLAGGELDARRDAAGGWHALGLHVRPAQGAVSAELAESAEPAALTESVASAEPAAAEQGGAGAPGLRRIALADGAALAFERLRVSDETLGPGARPLAGRIELVLDGPAVLVDPELPEPEPLTWRLGGALDGLAREWRIEGRASPFAPEPELALDLSASGVRTAGLCEVLALDAAGDVEDGVLEGRLTGTLFVRRGRPFELGLGRPFGAELAVDGLALRDGPEGALIVGAERIAADVERVDTSKGFVHVKRLELVRPAGIVRRGGDGWHVLGMCFGGEEQEGAEREAQAEAEAPAPVAIEAAAPVEREGESAEQAASQGELRIDEFLISGIDVEWREEGAEPPLVIPLTGFDFEVKRFTTRAFEEERPIQFSGLLATEEANGGRPLFDSIEVAGRMSFYPATAGWAQVSLSGLELARLSALAEDSGLKLEDGAFDGSARLRFKGAGGARVDSSLVFTDLDVEEPEGGPVQRLFSLPMALDTALALLRNQDGEHRFSLGFPMEDGKVSTGAVVLAGTKAFAELLARALAAIPLRLIGALVPGEPEEKPERAWTLAFAPGSTEVPAEAREVLAELQRELGRHGGRSLRLVHELGAEDLEHAERRANPSPERCLELAARLRQRRAELSRRADELASEARACYALGAPEAPAATQALRTVERELADAERALDGVLEILRSDSPRQRDKRTRAALREIAELRLAATAQMLRAGFFEAEQGMVEVVTPRLEVAAGESGGRVIVEMREKP